MLYALLPGYTSGQLPNLVIRLLLQAIYWLLNTDHDQPQIGILPEDCWICQASLSTLQPVWTKPRNRRHPILEAQLCWQSCQRTQRHARRPATNEGKQHLISFRARLLIRVRSTWSSQQMLCQSQHQSSHWEIASRTQTFRLVASRPH